MKTRIYIATILSMIIAVVVFGVGAAIVLTIGGVDGADAYGLAVAAIVAFIVSPIAGWIMAPHLRARFERRRSSPEV